MNFIYMICSKKFKDCSRNASMQIKNDKNVLQSKMTPEEMQKDLQQRLVNIIIQSVLSGFQSIC